VLAGVVTAIQREYLPALGSAQQELVLLPGWGSNRDVWRPLLAALRPWANVTLFDIPGLTPGRGDEAPDLAELVAALVGQLRPGAVLLGWSLGGQLALEVAARTEAAVAAVVTLCSNPCFQAREDWPGMSPALLAAFRANAAEDPGRTLRRFDSLQLEGSARARPLMRALQSLRAAEPGRALQAGLAWLQRLDQRALCQSLAMPQLHLLGARDGLLPPELAAALRTLLADNTGAGIEILPGCSHVAPLEAGDVVVATLRNFLERRGLLRETVEDRVHMTKADVAASFSRAAGQYDSVAQLQRDVGNRLLRRLEAAPRQPQRLLDLGSGTGYFAPRLKRLFPAAEYIGLDLAEGMVRFSRDHFPEAGAWLVADAEALPLATDSIDLVFSSLALQWCYRPQLLFAELARVLRPGGRCVFTSLGPDTLKELRAAWAAVDEHRHVNTFLPASELERAAATAGVGLSLEARPFSMQYEQVRQLLDELKTLGAHNVNRDRPGGLTGRRALQGMLRAYEIWRDNGVLPATYEVYFGVLQKT